MAKKLKVLVVDDLYDDLLAIKTALEKGGYEVETATNGARALDLTKADKFDLITVDINMPTVSGYDLLRLLKDKINGKSKIIYITIVPKKNVDLSNVDGFVQKPFGSANLLKEVKKVLKLV